MKKLFFIYSLPRSGSSWLSVFLSSPGSYCYHEPLADIPVSQLGTLLARRQENCIGAIDTSAYQRTDLYFSPDVTLFVLLREQSQIQRSMRMKGWVMDLESERSKLIKASKGALPIQYEKLWDINYLETIWDTIVGTPFDRERAERLMEMNIQRTFASVAKRVAS
jgi:hypothetical protein